MNDSFGRWIVGHMVGQISFGWSDECHSLFTEQSTRHANWSRLANGLESIHDPLVRSHWSNTNSKVRVTLYCMFNPVSTCFFYYQLSNSFVVVVATTTTTTTSRTTTTITTTTRTRKTTANSTRVFAIAASDPGCKLSIDCSLLIVNYLSYQLLVSYWDRNWVYFMLSFSFVSQDSWK